MFLFVFFWDILVDVKVLVGVYLDGIVDFFVGILVDLVVLLI